MPRLVAVRAVCDECSAAAAVFFCVEHRTVLCSACDDALHTVPSPSSGVGRRGDGGDDCGDGSGEGGGGSAVAASDPGAAAATAVAPLAAGLSDGPDSGASTAEWEASAVTAALAQQQAALVACALRSAVFHPHQRIDLGRALTALPFCDVCSMAPAVTFHRPPGPVLALCASCEAPPGLAVTLPAAAAAAAVTTAAASHGGRRLPPQGMAAAAPRGPPQPAGTGLPPLAGGSRTFPGKPPYGVHPAGMVGSSAAAAAAAATTAARTAGTVTANAIAGVATGPPVAQPEPADASASHSQSVHSGYRGVLGPPLSEASPSLAAAAMVQTERLRLLASSTSASTTTTVAMSGTDPHGTLPASGYLTPSVRRQQLQRLARRRRAHARRLSARQTAAARRQGQLEADGDAGLPPRRVSPPTAASAAARSSGPSGGAVSTGPLPGPPSRQLPPRPTPREGAAPTPSASLSSSPSASRSASPRRPHAEVPPSRSVTPVLPGVHLVGRAKHSRVGSDGTDGSGSAEPLPTSGTSSGGGSVSGGGGSSLDAEGGAGGLAAAGSDGHNASGPGVSVGQCARGARTPLRAGSFDAAPGAAASTKEGTPVDTPAHYVLHPEGVSRGGMQLGDVLGDTVADGDGGGELLPGTPGGCLRRSVEDTCSPTVRESVFLV
ncbi:hypothetical protein MMPV_000166 [Pyropia vietnamensis]